jgi:hypothetical protein
LITCEAPLEQVLKWIVEGQTDSDIYEAIGKHWPGTDPEALHQQAVDQVADASKVSQDVIVGWCFMARKELYRRMVGIGDFAGALRATEKIESLIKFLPPEDD